MSEERLVRVLCAKNAKGRYTVSLANRELNLSEAELSAATMPQPSRERMEELRRVLMESIDWGHCDCRQEFDALCVMASQAAVQGVAFVNRGPGKPMPYEDEAPAVDLKEARGAALRHVDEMESARERTTQAAAAMCGSEGVEPASKGGDTRADGSGFGTITFLPLRPGSHICASSLNSPCPICGRGTVEVPAKAPDNPSETPNSSIPTPPRIGTPHGPICEHGNIQERCSWCASPAPSPAESGAKPVWDMSLPEYVAALEAKAKLCDEWRALAEDLAKAVETAKDARMMPSDPQNDEYLEDANRDVDSILAKIAAMEGKK